MAAATTSNMQPPNSLFEELRHSNRFAQRKEKSDPTIRLVNETLELTASGEEEFSSVNILEENGRSVILIGETGVGKTTLINLIGEAILKVGYVEDEDRVFIDSDKPLHHFELGHRSLSQTCIPRKLSIEDVMYWDLPGLSDTRGPSQAIANAICVTKVFAHSKQAKLLLVMKEADLDDKGLNLMRFVGALDMLLPNQADKIQQSVALVVSRVSEKTTVEHLRGRIAQVKQEQTMSKSEGLILQIMSRCPIILFKRPTVGSYVLDAEPMRQSILANVQQLQYANGLTSKLSLPPECTVPLTGAYNQLEREMKEKTDQFTADINKAIRGFAAPFAAPKLAQNAAARQAGKQKLQDLARQLNQMLSQPCCLQTLPELIKSLYELVQQCNQTLDDPITCLIPKMGIKKSLEEWIPETSHLPFDLINSLKRELAPLKEVMEKAIANIDRKNAEEKAEQAKREAAERQRQLAAGRGRGRGRGKKVNCQPRRHHCGGSHRRHC